MIIEDHISSLIPSPLRGENVDELGVRFPDMSHVYDERMRASAREIARENGIKFHEGVYIQAPGPQYETPTEIKMYRAWGADAVGMSTVCEAIAARDVGRAKAAMYAHLTRAKVDEDAIRKAYPQYIKGNGRG